MKDGPYIDDDGVIRWFKNGRLHQTNGPAVIYPDGVKYWYLNGNFITSHENKFKNYVIQQNLKTLL